MANDTALKFIKLVLLILVIQVFLIGFVLWQSYEERVHLIDAQRASCERSKLDRKANAYGWRIAEQARLRSGQVATAYDYSNLAVGLESRSRVNCHRAFPKASIIP